MRRLAFLCVVTITLAAQDLTPPIPKRLVIHSNILSEDRVIWVRMPTGSAQRNIKYPVLYLTDGDGHINEIGSTIDFLMNQDRIPPLIVVGITNTDRTRDLTPTHVNDSRTSGGADKFIDFIQTELM